MGTADRTEEKKIAMLIQMMVTTDKHDGGVVVSMLLIMKVMIIDSDFDVSGTLQWQDLKEDHCSGCNNDDNDDNNDNEDNVDDDDTHRRGNTRRAAKESPAVWGLGSRCLCL